MLIRSTLCFVTLLGLFLCIGCGKRIPIRPVGMPETTPCLLTVTFGDERIEGVGVLLTPKDKSQRWFAGGMTDQEGKAALKTGGHYEGVIPGEYAVSFQKSGRVELDKNDMPIRSHSIIPAKYTASKSRETIIVTKSQVDYLFTLDGLSPSERQATELSPQE